MKKKLSVIIILAVIAACSVSLLTACVENVAKASDLYGDWYLAGNYDPESDTPDTTVTDFGRHIRLADNDGDPWAYMMLESGFEESYYALYDLVTGNDISLKKDNRWGDTVYTIDIVSEDVLSMTLNPSSADGEAPAGSRTYYFVKAES